MRALMREMSCCPQEPVPSFLATGNELFVLNGSQSPAQGVFRKWARDWALLTQAALELNSLCPVLLPRRSNYLCSYMQQ